MAGSKLKFTAHVQASSILEVIISMVVILLVFSIAMMISANVMRSSLSVKKIGAQAALHEQLIMAERDKEPGMLTFMMDSIRIDQEIKSYEGNEHLLEIHLAAYDTNQEKVAELQKVILKDK